jgi:hypothetical protein
MSEEQKDRIDQLIGSALEVTESAKKAEETYKKLIWTFAIAIFIAVSSVTALTVKAAFSDREINHIRENALNKDAFFSYQKIDQAHDLAILRAINDPETASAIEYFNKEKESIIDMILSSQTEITLRGGDVVKTKKFAK